MNAKLLAGLVAACFAAPALAQSNITIYGIVDAGLHISSNGEGTRTKLVSGITDGSRIGFKGVEDMGGGLKAIFNLEARFEVDNGTSSAGNISDNQGFALTKGLAFTVPAAAGGAATAAQLLAGVRSAAQPALNVNPSRALFDRTAYVGLITPGGAVLLGRQYTPGYEVFATIDPFESGTAASWGNLNSGAGGIVTAGIAIRSDEAVQYRMELPNGFAGALMYGFEKSGFVGLDKRMWAFNASYKVKDHFYVGLGHNHGTDQKGNRGLISTTLGGTYQTGDMKSVGDMKFYAGFHKQRNDHSVLIPAINEGLAPTFAKFGALQPVLAAQLNTALVRNFNLDASLYTLGMHYRVTSGRVMASISRQDDKNASNNDATQYGIGYDHFLSNRTDLFTFFGYIKNQNDSQYAAGAASAPGGFTSAPGQSGKAFQFGMRHKF